MEEKKKIRVLVVPSDEGGCKYWRMERPHLKLEEMFGDEFEVTIKNDVNYRDLEFINQFDILNIHKGITSDYEGFDNMIKFCNTNNIVVIIDVDDYWNLGQFHPLTIQNRAAKIPERTMAVLKEADYVTTTTHIFASEISKLNKNVEIYPNAVDTNDPQWEPDFSKKDKIRFGFIMGSSHERDMELFRGTINALPQEVKDKIQLVLCGYDNRGTITMIGPDGKVQGQRPITPHESVRYRYEQNVTDNYKMVSPEYKAFLDQYIPDSQYENVENEFYRREWTKNLTCFGTHYNNIDVLLVPLDTNDFNKYKSELKMVEAGFKHKAIVMSNFGPYTIGSKSIFQKGGVIDETGNCILIDPEKAHKDWVKAIKKLVEKPELIKLLADNLHAHVKDTYDLANVTKRRAEWYKSIVKR